jgi:hypothetical protein
MNCPKCSPSVKRRAWPWLLAIGVLVSAAAWFEASRPEAALDATERRIK